MRFTIIYATIALLYFFQKKIAMPKICTPIQDDTRTFDMAIWKTEESEDILYEKYPQLTSFHNIIDKCKSATRRIEMLSVRTLLLCLKEDPALLIHNEYGKPMLKNGKNISITHTKGYAAVITSHSHNVAIDIEYRSERVCKIAKRFIREDEDADSAIKKLLCWCAKETLYKLHSSDGLAFHDMRVHSFPDNLDKSSNGTIMIENTRRNHSVAIHFAINEAYILTYATEKVYKKE